MIYITDIALCHHTTVGVAVIIINCYDKSTTECSSREPIKKGHVFGFMLLFSAMVHWF